jgi:hypothetical protein
MYFLKYSLQACRKIFRTIYRYCRDNILKYLKVSCLATRHEGAWGERRYSSYSFSTSALDGGEWSASRPGHALPPVPIEQEAGWAPEPVWTQRLEEKSSASAGDRTPVVQSEVRHYWLSYPGSFIVSSHDYYNFPFLENQVQYGHFQPFLYKQYSTLYCNTVPSLLPDNGKMLLGVLNGRIVLMNVLANFIAYRFLFIFYQAFHH